MSLKIPIARLAEDAALSLIITDPESFTHLHWDASYFATNGNRTIFNAIEAVHARTGKINGVAVISELESTGRLNEAGGENRVLEVFKTIYMTPGPIAVDVCNDYRKQLLLAKSYRDALAIIGSEEYEIREMRADLADISDRIARCIPIDSSGAKTMKQHISELIDDLENKKKIDVFPTGLPTLDEHLIGGLHRGEMVVVGAQTSGGKSILLYQIALEALMQQKSVAIFSLEMPSKTILRRMASNMIGKRIVNTGDFGDGTSYVATHKEVFMALQKLISFPLVIRDDLSEVGEIDAEAHRLASMGKADVIVVDYLQIVSMPKADNREQAISELTRRLKLTALKTSSVVITASQLNDDGKLRESRAIGHHADHVLNISHEKSGSAIFIEKNRRGSRGVGFPVVMRGEISRFEEAEKQEKKK